MLKMSYAGAPGLSPAISAQFILKMCVAAGSRQKITKNSYFENLRSFKVIDVDTNEKLVTIACYDKQHVYAYLQPFFYATRDNYDKRTTFQGGSRL